MTDGVVQVMAPWPGPPTEAAPASSLVNYEAEQGLLGQLMVNNAAFDQVADFLEPHHFGEPVHGRIFAAIRSHLIQGRQADPRTLRPFFEADAGLTEVGGWGYLLKLYASITVMVNADEYGRRIFDDWRRREIVALADRMKAGARDLRVDRDVSAIVGEIEAELWDLDRDGTRSESLPEDISVGVDRYLEQADTAHKADGALIGVTTGIRGLNERTGGLHGSDLVVLAGPTGSGKTALKLNIATAAAEAELARAVAENRAPRAVLFFSLEMDDAQLAGRILAARTGIPTERVRKGQLRDHDFNALVEASTWLRSLPLIIDRSPAITVAQMRSRARRIQRRRGLLMIGVDYIQLAEGEGENRTQVVGAITRGLKKMAKELDVPVLASSQLSRAADKRDEKRPMLSDLRESGSIEQDADSVWLIYRHEQHVAREEPRRKTGEDEGRFADRLDDWEKSMTAAKGKAEVLVEKSRHGPTGTVKLRFDGVRQRFSDVDGDDDRQRGMFDDGAEQRG